MASNLCRICAFLLLLSSFAFAGGERIKMFQDPVTGYFHITYQVPANAPEEVAVVCSWSPRGKNDWKPAKVTPYISETGLRLASRKDWDQWMEGRITERRAAGLTRTIVFNSYPEAGSLDFRIQILNSTQTMPLEADNAAVYLSDWSKVLQKDAISQTMADGKWLMADGNLHGKAGIELPQLTYPLDLKGWYAIFVSTPPGERIGLRLSGDERTDYMVSARGREVFWRWCRMDRQHLILRQPHAYQGWANAGIEYVRLVPLTQQTVTEFESQFEGKRDKFVAGYFEPYSWAFNENVTSNLQHREPLTAFAEARVNLVDIQIGRFGAKVVYESRLTDQLLYSTVGDPIDGVIPRTNNVGQMQQYTNTLESELKYARELGLTPHANFGATNCYPGTPLQGDFSKEHPEWMREFALRYEVTEVGAYILSLIREALEIGAPGISIDFCRYPEGIDKAETCTQFLRELRKAAGAKPILIRFPAKGVRRWQNFDYQTWVREGLVDYLCPSNIQGRHIHFDIAPYVKAVKGSKCKLLPVVDGISWGPTMPGPYLWRVKQLYDAGADGIYIYQADDPVLYRVTDKRYVRLLGRSEAVNRWWKDDAGQRPNCSKGIYLSKPEDGVYHGYERLRVWLEGISMGELEMYLDGKLVSRYAGPPYILGTEDYESDGIIPPGEHKLLIRAKDGSGRLEQTFAIQGAG